MEIADYEAALGEFRQRGGNQCGVNELSDGTADKALETLDWPNGKSVVRRPIEANA